MAGEKSPEERGRLRPLHLNLLALACALAILTVVYVTLGRGLWFQWTMTVYGLLSGFQFLLLAVAANARRAPSPYASKLTFALWAAASYPFSALLAPPGMFPEWFFWASAPVGFVLAYPFISLFLWMVALLPKWPLLSAWKF
ncbi:hypothetical protein [Terricaulis sp.]|uniref:hypothetical protein n=1 Tax=Terricaulis sp. TaxID=2768686 RepID=UPI003783D020